MRLEAWSALRFDPIAITRPAGTITGPIILGNLMKNSRAPINRPDCSPVDVVQSGTFEVGRRFQMMSFFFPQSAAKFGPAVFIHRYVFVVKSQTDQRTGHPRPPYHRAVVEHRRNPDVADTAVDLERLFKHTPIVMRMAVERDMYQRMRVALQI